MFRSHARVVFAVIACITMGAGPAIAQDASHWGVAASITPHLVAIGDGVLNAVEFRKFTPFGTIKQRVQIGLEYGGGVGQFSGQYQEPFYYTEFVGFQGSRMIGRQATEILDLPPEEFSPFGKWMPVVVSSWPLRASSCRG